MDAAPSLGCPLTIPRKGTRVNEDAEWENRLKG